MFSSLAGRRLEGMSTGSASQPELAAAFSAPCHGGWFWSGTRTCLVRPLRSFRGRSIWCFRGGAFSSCSGGLLMSGGNMSVVRCAVVKGFATGCTSKRTLRGSLVVSFQVTTEMWFLAGWTFLAAGAFIQFVTSMDSLVFLEMVMASEGLVTGVTVIFLKRLFGLRLTFPGLNFIQLVNMT